MGQTAKPEQPEQTEQPMRTRPEAVPPKRLLPLLCLLLPPLSPSPAPAQHFPPDHALQLMVRYLVEDGEAPGVVLGVLEPDGTTRIVSHGRAGPDGEPVGPDTRFEIGSITKTFTATLLADMVLREEVAMDDPVSKYLPDHVTVPSRGGREITLRDLATHQSGLPTVPDDFDPPGPRGADRPYTVEDAYAFLSRYELERDPGAEREYSNFAYGLLGHALGRAAGTGYREAIRTRILEPLGMESTGFAGEPGEGLMATGHRGGEPVRHRSVMEIFDGAGALYSTAEDLLAYLAAHVGPAETDLEEAMRFASQVWVRSGDEGGGQGLGWGTGVFPGESPVVGHGGGTVGFQAQLSFMPAAGTGVVVLTNDAHFDDEIGTSLLYPDPPPAAWEPVPVDPSVLARYAGVYEPPSGRGAYYVRLEEEGFLTYQPRRQVRTPLYARSDSTFYMMRAPWSFTFRGAGGDGGAGEAVGSAEVAMVMEVDAREPGQEGTRRVALKVKEETPSPRAVAGHAGFRLPGSPVVWVVVGVGVLVGLVLLLRPVWSRRGG